MPQGKIICHFVNPIFAQPKTKAEIRAVRKSFGLFGDPPSTSGFDPKTNVENDVIPKEEDYVFVPFRMISATILGAGTWKATDFSDEKVLKKSVGLLENKPIYVNHNLSDVMNNVGVIVQAKWTPAFKAPDGTQVPAGIDGLFKIDAKVHPKVARDLLSTPPSIQSDSVTVLYQYEPSHEFTRAGEEEPDNWEFEMKIGTMVDGKMVRRIATYIEDYIECSLVSLGADPFGKIKVGADNKISVDGVPLNIDKSGIAPASAYNVVKFDADPLKTVYEEKSEYFVRVCFEKENNLHLKNKLISNSQNLKNSKAMDEILAFLAAQLGINETEVTAEALKKYKFMAEGDFKKTNDLAASVPVLNKKIETLTAEKDAEVAKVTERDSQISTLKKEKEDLQPFATLGTNLLNAKKMEAEKLYRLSAGTKADETFVGLIKKSDEKELDAILKQYGKTLMETFSGHCKKCHSTDIDFRSTVPDGKEDPGTVESEHMAFSFTR